MKEKIKTLMVSLIVFFGTAFAIMSFNEDVAVGDLFQKVYVMTTGKEHDGLGILELSYGLGISLGITMFYNRLADKKNGDNEPTPIEIKMKQYEDDVNDYLEYQSKNKVSQKGNR